MVQHIKNYSPTPVLHYEIRSIVVSSQAKAEYGGRQPYHVV